MLKTVKCQCGKTIQVNKQLAGRKIPCPYCSTPVPIPVELPAATPPPVQTKRAEPKKESSIDVRFLVTLLIVLLMLMGGVGVAILVVLKKPDEPIAAKNVNSETSASPGPKAPYRIEYEDRLWFLVFDFQKKQIGDQLQFSINYEFAQGVPPVGNYVWVVEAENIKQPELKANEKPLVTFFEFPFDGHLKKGTLKRLARPDYETKKWKTFFGLKVGTGKYERISAETTIGAFPTSPVPPSPKDVAGDLLKNLPVAFANARYKAGNKWELMVDYELVKSFNTDSCFLVVAGIDHERIDYDIGKLMSSAKKQGTIVVPKPKKNLRKPIVVYMETREKGARRPQRLANPAPVL